MPMGSRDIWLVLRAKDYASRTVQQVGRELGSLESAQRSAMQRQVAMGAILTTTGVALAGAGIEGLHMYENMGKAALAYNKQAALTLTQVDQTGVSLQTIKNIGIQVASAIPAPFKEMQASLFDIFSSMNVNTTEAKTLLTGFAKAAVAGNVDVQTAGRETIALMNAYQIPVSKLNDVLDFQFQLVRKGVGTYAEFASTIGRAIPNAVKAGQSYQELGGALAFATRNGLSTAMAATAVARAMDVMSKPVVVKRLAAMGVNALNLDGSFRPLSQTLGDLGAKLKGMTDIKRIEVLDALFKGQGNAIQARRFLDLVLKNTDALKGFVADMNNSKGALGTAYDIMFKQGANQAQLLSNNLEILKTTMGDAVLPVFNLVVGALIELVQWFNNLDPGIKKAISIIGLLFFALMTIVGVGLTVAGAIALLGAAATALGTTLGGLALAFAAVLLVIAAVAFGAYELITHWKDVVAWFKKLVLVFQNGGFNAALAFVGQQFMLLWDTYIYPGLKKAYDKISGWITGTLVPLFQEWGPKLAEGLWGWIQTNGPVILGWLGDRLNDIGNWVTGTAIPYLQANIPIWLDAMWGWLSDTAVPWIIGKLDAALTALGNWITGTAWPYLTANFPGWMQALWGWIQEGAAQAGSQMWIWLQSLGDWITGTAVPWLTIKMKELVPALTTWILTEGVPKLIELGLSLAMALTDWIITQAIPFLATHLPVWLAAIVLFIVTIAIPQLIKALGALARDAMQGMLNVLDDKGREVLQWFLELPGKILTMLGDLSQKLTNAGMQLISGLLWGAIQAAFDLFVWVGGLPGVILGYFDNAITWLWQIGVDIITGLWHGMQSVWGSVTNWLTEAAKNIAEPWRLILKSRSPSLVMTEIGQDIMQGLHNGLIQAYGPISTFISTVTKEMVQRFLDAKKAAETSMVKAAADYVVAQMQTEQQRVNAFLTSMAASVASKLKEITDGIAKAKIDAAILQQIANDPNNSVAVRAAANGVTPGTSITPENSTQFYIYRNGNSETFFGSYQQALAEAAGGLVTPIIQGLNDPGTQAQKAADAASAAAQASPVNTPSSVPTSTDFSTDNTNIGSSSGSSTTPAINVVYNITVEGSIYGMDDFDEQLQEKLAEHDKELMHEFGLT